MSHDFARMTLNCAIEALLAEGSVQQRLSKANRYIRRLEQHRSGIPDQCLDTLMGIVDKLTHPMGAHIEDHCTEYSLSPEQEFTLVEELLSLYMIASGGVLTF
jgi:hypothetical protein